MKKKTFIIAISFVFAILIATFTSTYLLLFNKPFNVAGPTFIYIDNDDSTDSVFTKIKSNLNPQSMTGLKMLARIKDYDENIFPGAYRMDAGTTTLEAFRKLKSGNQTPVRLIVPSVRTLDKLVSRVSKQIMADSASIAALLNDSSFIKKIGYNYETLPALFIPNTYEVYWNMSAENFIRRMEKENRNFWNEERKAKAKALNMTQRPIVTMIVERSEVPVGFRTKGPNNRLIIVEGIGDMVLRNGKRIVCLKMRRSDDVGMENVSYADDLFENEWYVQAPIPGRNSKERGDGNPF